MGQARGYLEEGLALAPVVTVKLFATILTGIGGLRLAWASG